MSKGILTIGHSNHDTSSFLDLIRKYKVSAIADVRSMPRSHFVPQYNQKSLMKTLKSQGIAYAFLGNELGGRSDNPDYYINGRVQYSLIANDPRFSEGISRIKRGIEKYKIAIMCSEKDPIDCHRGLLIAPCLVNLDISVTHILSNGNYESHENLEERLLERFSLVNKDMFMDRSQLLRKAYELQENRVASMRQVKQGSVDEEQLI